MVYDIIMWFYASMALLVGVLLFMRWAKPKPPPQFPLELVCDGCGQVCSDLLGGYCEYCVKKLAQ